jgi:uncharacterized membrane protein
MQFKPIVAIIVLLLVVVASLTVAGCTTTTDNTATNQPTTTDMISSLTTYFNSTKKEIITNSFKQTTLANHTAYIGTFKDGADKLTPKIHNYTVFVANNNTDAKTLFAQQVNAVKSEGYVENTPTLDTQWRGWYKSTTSDANGLVHVTVCEPHSCTATVSNEFALRDPSSFVVTVERVSNT